MPLLRVTVLSVLVMASVATVLSAQPPAAAGGSSDAPRPSTGAATAADDSTPAAGPSMTGPSMTVPAADIEFVRTTAGQLKPVIPGVQWDRFQQWLKQQAQIERSEKFQIRSLVLDGTAEDDRVLLTAKINVTLFADGEWVEVPLRLNEAVLRDAPQLGTDEGRLLPPDRDGGYRCLLRGKGEHELTLSLIVPLSRKMPGRRLQLSLPQKPQSVSSSLSLRVPVAASRLSATAQPADTTKPAVVQTAAVEGGKSSITVHGLGERIDLTWQELPNLRQDHTALQAETTMRVRLTSDLVVLGWVSQKVQPLQGSVSQLAIRLPTGVELLGLHVGQQETKAPEHDPSAVAAALGSLWGVSSDPGAATASASMGTVLTAPVWTIVKLSGPTTSPVDLEWEFRAPLISGGALKLEGFQVKGAIRETGTIHLETDDGYQLTKESGDDVYQVGVSPLADGARTTRAYAFRKQPFQLKLNVQEIKPHYSVEPLYFLRVGADRADLVADFRLNVLRGAVQDLELQWPQAAGNKWVVDPLDQTELVEQATTDPATGTIRIRFLERQTKGSTLHLSLRAHCPVTQGDDAPWDVTLPTPTGRRQPSILLLAKADEMEANLAALAGTSIRSLPVRLTADADRWLESLQLVDDRWRELRRTAYSVETATTTMSHTLQARLTRHAPQLRCDSVVAVRLENDRARVTQRLQFDVAYALQTQVRLGIPRELAGSVRFVEVTEGGEELSLTTNPAATESGGQTQIWVPLSDGHRGRFEIIAYYDLLAPLDVEGEETRSLSIPLLQSTDAPFQNVRVSASTSEPFQFVIKDPAWQLQPGTDQTDQWVARDAKSAVPLVLLSMARDEALRFSVTKALIRSFSLRDGYVQARGSYRIAGRPASITLNLPPQFVEPDAMWWNETPLDFAVNRDTGECRLELPETGDGDDHLLTVDFHSTLATPYEWNQEHRLVAPQWPSNVWVAHTVWEVTMPGEQHLFTLPESFTPQFTWERATLFWHRVPTVGYADLESWIGAVQGPPALTDFSRGNTYVFSRTGPARSILFWSMNRSVVVLLGAGLAVAAGFLLLKIPATRHIMTALVVGFAIAVAGLWYAGPVQVLLQPALLGLVLAAAAAWTDGTLTRRRIPTALPLSSPGDYLPTASHPPAPERGYGGVIGSEDPTALRPPVQSESHRGVSVLSGPQR